MKPLYISSSGPTAPARRLLSSTPHPPAPSSKSHLGSCRLGPPLLWPLLGGGGVCPCRHRGEEPHLIFPSSLPPAPPSLPPHPPRLHLRTHLELLTFYLHYIHHSVPSSHLSWIVCVGGVVLSLGRWWGNRESWGDRRHFLSTPFPLDPLPGHLGGCAGW